MLGERQLYVLKTLRVLTVTSVCRGQNAQLEKQYHEVLRELESKETDHMMETSQLREEISKLRIEMEGILQELQTLMDAKLSLELEICAYRKLLEGEENRSVPPHVKRAEAMSVGGGGGSAGSGAGGAAISGDAGSGDQDKPKEPAANPGSDK